MYINNFLSLNLRKILDKSGIDYEQLQEIRLRVNRPMIINYAGTELLLDKEGHITSLIQNAYNININEIKETLEYICSYSMYAYEEEIKQGYITIQGGHRIGLCGKVILENGHIKAIRNISFLNIRIAHEIVGCSEKIMKYVICDDRFYNTLIISPPGCGKTTLLRDIVRNISNNCHFSVGIVDERSEIAASYLGCPQNDVGIRTDVLDGCLKSDGIMMLVRTMSPGLIAVDEIGGNSDIDAITYGANCGCGFICTIHGENLKEIMVKDKINNLIKSKIFSRYILLNRKTGDKLSFAQLITVYDGDMKKVIVV